MKYTLEYPYNSTAQTDNRDPAALSTYSREGINSRQLLGAKLFMSPLLLVLIFFWNRTMKMITVFNLYFYQSEITYTFPKEQRVAKHYINCNFTGILYNHSVEIRGDFRNCVFVNGDFNGLKIKGNFENCNFVGSIFENVEFEESVFNRCDFSGTIFLNPKGMYNCKFKDTCNFEFSSGLSINNPVTDEGILIVSKKVSDGVPKSIQTEKTEKVEINNPDPYDSYEIDNVEDLSLWSRTRHGRRSIGFNPKRDEQERYLNRYRTKEVKDESAILICSREGLI